jgi:hypothetical protein
MISVCEQRVGLSSYEPTAVEVLNARIDEKSWMRARPFAVADSRARCHKKRHIAVPPQDYGLTNVRIFIRKFYLSAKLMIVLQSR